MAQGRTSDATYLQFCNQMDDAILRVILSQTGTSKSEAQGLGGSQSDVMKDVRDEVVAADSDVLHESFNRTVVAAG
jgi:phage gp29-like protein